MRISPSAWIALAAIALAACGGKQETTVERHLTVTGPREAVERYVARQGSRRPVLAASDVTMLGDGRATATLVLPRAVDGGAVVRLSREALEGGLSYELENIRSTATKAP